MADTRIKKGWKPKPSNRGRQWFTEKGRAWFAERGFTAFWDAVSKRDATTAGSLAQRVVESVSAVLADQDLGVDLVASGMAGQLLRIGNFSDSEALLERAFAMIDGPVGS